VCKSSVTASLLTHTNTPTPQADDDEDQALSAVQARNEAASAAARQAAAQLDSLPACNLTIVETELVTVS
jgi:hypothetical protein